jgi:hypothetical protein
VRDRVLPVTLRFVKLVCEINDCTEKVFFVLITVAYR